MQAGQSVVEPREPVRRAPHDRRGGARGRMCENRLVRLTGRRVKGLSRRAEPALGLALWQNLLAALFFNSADWSRLWTGVGTRWLPRHERSGPLRKQRSFSARP